MDKKNLADRIKCFFIHNAYWLGTAFAIIVLLLATPFAHAQTNPSAVNSVDVSKLTPEQRAQILSTVAQLQ